MGLHKSKVVYLIDFRQIKEIIAWGDFLKPVFNWHVHSKKTFPLLLANIPNYFYCYQQRNQQTWEYNIHNWRVQHLQRKGTCYHVFSLPHILFHKSKNAKFLDPCSCSSNKLVSIGKRRWLKVMMEKKLTNTLAFYLCPCMQLLLLSSRLYNYSSLPNRHGVTAINFLRIFHPQLFYFSHHVY